jgi:hypothetical protein
MIEIDYLAIVKLIKNNEVDLSFYTTTTEEIKTLIKVRQSCITHVKRC